jgi:hypothetical protein
MAVPMDHELSPGNGGMPPDAPLDMEPQNLRYPAHHRRLVGLTSTVLFARLILIGVTIAITAYGTYGMLQVVRFASMTFLQGLMIFFFSISLAWIAFSAGSVLAGWSKRHERLAPEDAPTGVTALVMPIYNEDPQRTMSARAGDGRGPGGPRLRRRLRDRRAVGLDQRRRLDTREPRDWPVAHRARRTHGAVVPAPLAQYCAQVRQHRGIRAALGRPLRLHDRAGRGQPDRCAHPEAARPDDVRRRFARHPADCAATDRGLDFLRPPAAVRRLRLRSGDHPRTGCVVGQCGQLLGTQRDHPHLRLRRQLRTAGARGAPAIWRTCVVARFRRGRADAPCRLEGLHGDRARGILGGIPAVADRHCGARPALGAGQSAAPENHLDGRACPLPAGCISGSAS